MRTDEGEYGILKTSLVIPPAAALLLVLAWNLSQWREVGEQQEKNADLHHRVEAAKSTKADSRPHAPPSRFSSPASGGPIDWDDLSVRLKDIQSGSKDTHSREMQDLQKQLAAMDDEELIDALDQISSMGLTEDARRPLEDLLLGVLIAADPELALDRFASRIPENSQAVNSQLAEALQLWAMDDPAAASSWLDRQIQAGLFEATSLDGRNDALLEFEASLVAELLSSDPAAAGMRVAALPEEQRREVLAPIPFADLDDDARMAYVDLIRELVPKDENPGAFVHIVSELIPTGGYDQVDAFLDQIDATDAERAVSARHAAISQLGALAAERPLTRDDVDDMRRWLQTQSPGDVETVTGRALGEVVQDGGQLSFQEASALILDYQKNGGNDEVLAAFLRSFAARSNLEQAASLAEMVKDPALRRKFLDELN